MRLYDRIIALLNQYPKLRDSDKLLAWAIWKGEGAIDKSTSGIMRITLGSFIEATSFESIRRCRCKIQEEHPELRSSRRVQQAKDVKELSKGTFVYREETRSVLQNTTLF